VINAFENPLGKAGIEIMGCSFIRPTVYPEHVLNERVSQAGRISRYPTGTTGLIQGERRVSRRRKSL
jgi:hypothetical protein